MKRFYKTATVARTEDGHRVELDGRPVNTPGKARLAVPTHALAQAIAAEWNAQDTIVVPAAMPLTQLANTAIDRVARERAAVVDVVRGYAETDLLCYRADRPAALADRQGAAWQPLLDWAALTLDAPLAVTCGVLPAAQPAGSVAAIGRALEAHDDFSLTAVAHAAGLLGSAVLALALVAGRIDAGEAFDAAHLDETFQHERWGVDEEAAARLDRLRAEIAATERFLRLLES